MSPTRDIQVFPTAANLFHAAAEEFMRVARTAIGAQGRFTVALAGGSTPKGLYSLLATNYASFGWNRVFLFFGDERHVPPTDAESNYGMVNETLLSKIQIPGENVFRVLAENTDATAAASDYESRIRKFFQMKAGEFPRFDLILLGMGPDGHTASLFPDSAGLNDQQHIVIANWVEKFKQHRITFTFPVLNRAAEILFLVCGADKATVLAQVLKGESAAPPSPAPPSNATQSHALPSQIVQPSDGKILWMIDEAAAAKLPR
jgi:6-phosphogluconolactonase